MNRLKGAPSAARPSRPWLRLTVIATLVALAALPRWAVAAAAPSIALTPASGAAGSGITIDGRNFTASTPGFVTWQGTAAAFPRVYSTRSGAIRATVTVPSLPAGAYTVTVTVGADSASATFTITGSGNGSGRGSTPAPTSTPQPTATPAPVSGPVDFRVELGAEQWGLPPDTQLGSLPDTHTSMVWTGPNQVALFFSSEVRGYVFKGSSLDSLQPLATTNGAPVAQLMPSGSGFDSEYAAFGTVMPGPSGELVGFYHAEMCDRHNYTASIGVATSTDGGTTWQRKGRVITGRNASDSCAKTRPSGAGQPSAVRVGEYVYVYFTDWNDKYPDTMHLARAPFSQMTQASAWQKWSNGSFSTPGIGGDSQPILERPAPVDRSVYISNPGVSYNTYLKKYLLTFTTNDGFYITTSSDAIHFDAPKLIPLYYPQLNSQVEKGDVWYGYLSLISHTETTSRTSNATGYIYYAKGVWGVDSHHLMRRPFTISITGAAPPPSSTPQPTATPSPAGSGRTTTGPALTPTPVLTPEPRR